MSKFSACHCIGKQPGEPECPCVMRARGIFKRDGRWIQPECDLGPAPDDAGGKSFTYGWSAEPEDNCHKRLMKNPEDVNKQILGGFDGHCLNDAMDKACPETVGHPRSLSCSCPKCSLR